MNSPEVQSAAVQALRNANDQQLRELVSVLTTCCHGMITFPPQPTPPLVARKVARRRALPDGPAIAPKRDDGQLPLPREGDAGAAR